MSKKIVSRFKKRIRDFKVNFKKKLKDYRQKPKSKRKSFIIGFATTLGIFGLTLFGQPLAAVAKDIPKGNPKPTDVAQAPSLPPSKEVINSGLSGLAATVCGLAVTSGSFAVGVGCGVIVVIGILHLQGK